ncbi:MAG: transposase [Thermoplasmatales archaeon]
MEANSREYGKPRDGDANTRRSRDGRSATKNHKKHFGYRAHILVNEIKIMEKLSVTSANVHDSQIDLSIPDVICYRDGGYFGSECKGLNGTMDRAVRKHKLLMQSIR